MLSRVLRYNGSKRTRKTNAQQHLMRLLTADDIPKLAGTLQALQRYNRRNILIKVLFYHGYAVPNHDCIRCITPATSPRTPSSNQGQAITTPTDALEACCRLEKASSLAVLRLRFLQPKYSSYSNSAIFLFKKPFTFWYWRPKAHHFGTWPLQVRKPPSRGFPSIARVSQNHWLLAPAGALL